MNLDNTIKNKRRNILKDTKDKRTVVHKGNMSVKSIRHCSVCGKPLTRLVSGYTNKFIATHTHFYIKLGWGLNFSLCYDNRSCLRYLTKNPL